MKIGKNLKDIPRASEVLKLKNATNGIEKNKQDIKKKLSEVLNSKLEKYSEKNAETMYGETLEKLKGTFEIPKDLSNKVVQIINYENGEFIFVRGDSIIANVSFGPGDVGIYSINKKTNSYDCTLMNVDVDSSKYKPEFVDLCAVAHKTKEDVFLGLDNAVDAIIKNKEKCKIDIKDEEMLPQNIEQVPENAPDEMYDYFSQMKDEYLGKIMGKDEKYNERKDYSSDKYALSKTITKYGYDNVMKLKYFKDIQESIDNYDNYLSELGEEIEDF